MIYSIDNTTTTLAKLVPTGPFAWTLTQSASTILTWNSRQTHRHFKNDARKSTEVLLPFNRNIRQKLRS